VSTDATNRIAPRQSMSQTPKLPAHLKTSPFPLSETPSWRTSAISVPFVTFL
jgi:hypothetical protein